MIKVGKQNLDTGGYETVLEENPIRIDEAFTIHAQMDGSYMINCTGTVFVEPQACNAVILRISDLFTKPRKDT